VYRGSSITGLNFEASTVILHIYADLGEGRSRSSGGRPRWESRWSSGRDLEDGSIECTNTIITIDTRAGSLVVLMVRGSRWATGLAAGLGPNIDFISFSA
jgi:hypothetical protein